MKAKSKSKDPFVGSWKSIDIFGSSVVYRVRKAKAGYSVMACDSSDGELADIMEVKWQPKTDVLSFSAYWNSTGRFARCELLLVSAQQVSLTYTYTDSEVLVPALD